MRFDTQAQADDFLSKLAAELSGRMEVEGVVGRALTLKLMKQRDVSFAVVVDALFYAAFWCMMGMKYLLPLPLVFLCS